MNGQKEPRKFKPVMPRGLLLWVLLVVLGISIFRSYLSLQVISTHNTDYSSFTEDVGRGDVEKVTMKEDRIIWETYGGRRYTAQRPAGLDLQDLLKGKYVRFEELPPIESSWWRPFLWYFVPVLIFIGFWFFMLKGAQGGGRIMSFGKSRARQSSDGKLKITFKDVAGVDEAKEELTEIIEFLKEPKRFQKLGGKIPKGVLLMGPPGTGKTLLAKAVAGEAGVPFFSISGSDFVEMFVGVGASRVRDLFEQGKKSAKMSGRGCIIFIDEIDAVGRQRFAGIGGGHDEREQTLNALLVEMDGFDTQEGVILIAATNRPDVLDPALMRPGRFDRQVVIDRPDLIGREEILKVHVRNIKLDKNVALKTIARQTPGFSGADIANLSNEAALLAARKNKSEVGMEELEAAIERVIAGPERKSKVISVYEKKIIAYHESGHAILALMVPGADKLHKVSIIPRGMALGYTMQTPVEDRYITTKKELLGKLAGLLGGRASEEIIFDELTTGAHNDLEVATELSRRMVCEWGMSDKLGYSTFGRREGPVFLGRDIVEEKNYSEETAVAIDLEIRKFVEDAYARAKDILLKNKDKLQLLAETLLGKEVMGEVEVKKLLGLEASEELPPEAQPSKNEESGDKPVPQA